MIFSAAHELEGASRCVSASSARFVVEHRQPRILHQRHCEGQLLLHLSHCQPQPRRCNQVLLELMLGGRRTRERRGARARRSTHRSDRRRGPDGGAPVGVVPNPCAVWARGAREKRTILCHSAVPECHTWTIPRQFDDAAGHDGGLGASVRKISTNVKPYGAILSRMEELCTPF